MRSKLVLTALCLVVSGCASIRVVKAQPGRGGVIALNGPMDDARKKAMGEAKRNCAGKKVKVVEEGEAKIGSSTSGSTKGGRKSGDSTSETESVDKTEWRMTYKCAKK